jgi:hypothetical protein
MLTLRMTLATAVTIMTLVSMAVATTATATAQAAPHLMTTTTTPASLTAPLLPPQPPPAHPGVQQCTNALAQSLAQLAQSQALLAQATAQIKQARAPLTQATAHEQTPTPLPQAMAQSKQTQVPLPGAVAHEETTQAPLPQNVEQGAAQINPVQELATCQSIALTGSPPFYADCMGDYVLQPANTTGGRPAYLSRNFWLYFGPKYGTWQISTTLGAGACHFNVHDKAQTPDAITAGWSVIDDSSKWVEVPSMEAACSDCSTCVASSSNFWCYNDNTCYPHYSKAGDAVCPEVASCVSAGAKNGQGCSCELCSDPKCSATPPTSQARLKQAMAQIQHQQAPMPQAAAQIDQALLLPQITTQTKPETTKPLQSDCMIIVLSGTPPVQASLMGEYVLQQNSGGRPAYAGPAGHWLHFNSDGSDEWWVSGKLSDGRVGFLYVDDGAQTPDLVTGTWRAWNPSSSTWLDVPTVKAVCANGPGKCIGQSVNLTTTDCAAWQSFWDSTDGKNWELKVPRDDPCYMDPIVACAGSHVTR